MPSRSVFSSPEVVVRPVGDAPRGASGVICPLRSAIGHCPARILLREFSLPLRFIKTSLISFVGPVCGVWQSADQNWRLPYSSLARHPCARGLYALDSSPLFYTRHNQSGRPNIRDSSGPRRFGALVTSLRVPDRVSLSVRDWKREFGIGPDGLLPSPLRSL